MLALAGPAGAETARQPLSAIDWLSRSVTDPAAAAPRRPAANEPAVVASATVPPITTRVLGGPTLDGLGILSPEASGLPHDLWGASPSEELVRLIRTERVDTLPSIQALLMTLLLAELAPPDDATQDGALFLARIDKLLDLGALDPALSLLERVKDPEPEVFRRWFDVALLTGNEDRACEVMLQSPEIAPTFPARIFCLARGGDWNAAALSLRTGEALGYIDRAMADLLSRFLDPDLYEGEPDLPLPSRPSPLVFRLMEAIGQPMQTTLLPLAFAQSDLRANTGWKTRLDAAERLARTGAIAPNQLFGLYSEQKAAASGGVWTRVRLVAELDRALDAGDDAAITRTLPKLWSEMAASELEVSVAQIFGDRLCPRDLAPEIAPLAFRICLLTPDFERWAGSRPATDTEERFLAGIARGRGHDAAPPDQLGVAIAEAFAPDRPLSDEFTELVARNRVGEAILRAIDKVTEGARGDLREVTEGLQLMRAVGLETTARRAALELVILERRG
ncbi:MAG: hypothetical protein H6895_08165 [Defluviimonas sp.]|nr:hypothetical protein [Paracoccaceae bacterium]MCC0064046.1 hypothetical protein [Defluviimonas sp.]